MEAFSPWPFVGRVILCWPAQSSKTQVALNCLAYAVDQDPGPALCVLPNENKAKDYLNHKLKPMFRTSPRLFELLSDAERDINTRSIRLNNGANIRVAWATSAAELAQDSYRYTIRDETDSTRNTPARKPTRWALSMSARTPFLTRPRTSRSRRPPWDTGIIWVALTKEADEIREYLAVCPICGPVSARGIRGLRRAPPRDRGQPQERDDHRPLRLRAVREVPPHDPRRLRYHVRNIAAVMARITQIVRAALKAKDKPPAEEPPKTIL